MGWIGKPAARSTDTLSIICTGDFWFALLSLLRVIARSETLDADQQISNLDNIWLSKEFSQVSKTCGVTRKITPDVLKVDPNCQ